MQPFIVLELRFYNMIIKIAILDKTFDDDKFIIAHPNEKLSCIKHKSDSIVYTFLFSKATIHFSPGTFVGSKHVLTKVFTLVLLHQLCRFLQTNVGSKAWDKAKTIADNISLNTLKQEVTALLMSKRLRRIYFTTEYFFRESYGTLTNICDGDILYPPTTDPIFVPPLAMSKYIEDRHSLLFYNRHQVFNVLFETYDMDNCVTVVNPYPVYNETCNYIIRNYHSNVCEIRPKFQFQPRGRAKLNWTDKNDRNDYIFLLQFRDTYVQVLAIYPQNTVKKNMTVLRKKTNIDIKGTHVKRIISRLNSTEPTSIPIKLIFSTLTADSLLSEKVTFSLYEWLMESVKPYFRDVILEHSLIDNPTSDLKVLDFGVLKVYTDSSYLQFLLKVDSCSFFYSQKEIDHIQFIQVYVDTDEKNVGSEINRFVRFTSMVRLLLHEIIVGAMHPVLSCLDVDLHEQIWLYELKLKKVLNLTNNSKHVIL